MGGPLGGPVTRSTQRRHIANGGEDGASSESPVGSRSCNIEDPWPALRWRRVGLIPP